MFATPEERRASLSASYPIIVSLLSAVLIAQLTNTRCHCLDNPPTFVDARRCSANESELALTKVAEPCGLRYAA